MKKFTVLSYAFTLNLLISGVSGAASLSLDQQSVLNDLATTNLSTATFPWNGQPNASSTNWEIKRWDISPGNLIPVKLNGSTKAAEAIQTIERVLGMQLFDTQSIALTPDAQINRGVIVSLGTSYVIYTPDDRRNVANVSAGPNMPNYPWNFYQANGTISTKLYVNLGTSMIAGDQLDSDIVIHEFFHAMGFGSHFDGFGNWLTDNDPLGFGGDAMSSHAFDVMKTLYSNPIGTTASNLNIYANTAPVPVPTAAWLLGSGLLSLVGVARRKAA
ncbi:hypothetical protein SCD_n00774 [Sulfuricella denitrificans skB26]|uniref:VPLPA-CTERM sorting domain-containing protein n=1 Tax=Sulfuricella denitrificans (strain DSM 22764 / NBRC 105220 / skB26) TaxID=1163617 RepID=S6AFF5_SULDS|nr:hypothetical protein [Sulfuricella denitrificans]BAN34616.1 hypothetical protein SCD_n00774 [Sulfuricella denitrificans skB26]